MLSMLIGLSKHRMQMSTPSSCLQPLLLSSSLLRLLRNRMQLQWQPVSTLIQASAPHRVYAMQAAYTSVCMCMRAGSHLLVGTSACVPEQRMHLVIATYCQLIDIYMGTCAACLSQRLAWHLMGSADSHCYSSEIDTAFVIMADGCCCSCWLASLELAPLRPACDLEL